MITNKQKEELTIECVKLISKTLVDLGQTKSAEDISILASTLSNDLINDKKFNGLTFQDIQESFYRGLRDTDLFSLNIKTFYTWIMEHKRKIDVEACKQNEIYYKPNPELTYRNRKGTGLKKLKI